MDVDVAGHLGRRPSSSAAKNADAVRRISLVRRSSRTSRSSAAILACPGWWPLAAGRRRSRPGPPRSATTQVRSQLAGDPVDDPEPLAGLLDRLQHHPNRALAQLGWVALLPGVRAAVVCHDSIFPSKRWSLHTSQYGSPATRAYAQRRRAQGKTNREIKRCLVRYVARQLFRLLEREAGSRLVV
jgi:hypothetical protein